MTTEQIVQFLRLSINISDPDGGAGAKYLSLSDGELALYLGIALSQPAFTDAAGFVPALGALEPAHLYLLACVAKKELYLALAAKAAPSRDMGADSNNYLKNDQIFQHWLALAKQAGSDAEKAAEDLAGAGAGGVLSTYDVVASSRFYTGYNRDRAPIPLVRISADSVGLAEAEISWALARVRRFYGADVYCGVSPILDMHSENPVGGAASLYHTGDVRQTRCRIEGLEPDTPYYVAVAVCGQSGAKGYSEIEIRTLPGE
jgi:hypothetical protein